MFLQSVREEEPPLATLDERPLCCACFTERPKPADMDVDAIPIELMREDGWCTEAYSGSPSKNDFMSVFVSSGE